MRSTSAAVILSIRPKMDELMKTFEGKGEEEADEDPTDVTGLLGVHIAEVHLEDDEYGNHDNLTLQASFRDQTKCFPFTSSSDKVIYCGSTKNFKILLPLETDSPDNWLEIKLSVQSPLLALDRSTQLGKGSPVLGSVELKIDSGDVFCTLSAEFVFTYGTFGYGESFQLRHHVKRPGHFLHFSMFPRIPPPESRADNNGILTPLPLSRPSFIPFKQKSTLCVGKAASEEVQSSSLPISQPRLLASKMTRLNGLRSEYEKRSERHQRLAFLQKVVSAASSSEGSATRVTPRDRRHGLGPL